MNGRVFDPKIGRFMSGDPFVQDPSNTQSLNRLSYTFNDPGSYVDPSGYFAFLGFSFSFSGAEGAAGFTNPWVLLAEVVVSAASYYVEHNQQSYTGSAPSSYGNGSPSPNISVSACTAANGCMSLDNQKMQRKNPIVDASVGTTGSDQTSGNFENGATTPTFSFAVTVLITAVAIRDRGTRLAP